MTIGRWYRPFPNAKGNGRLIAASPALLALAVKLSQLAPGRDGLGGHAPLAAFTNLAGEARNIIENIQA